MSTPMRDYVESIDSLARKTTDFMYQNGKSKNPRIEHTKEELEEQLEYIRVMLFDIYNCIAKEYGWIE